jgi:hypothetical protein
MILIVVNDAEMKEKKSNRSRIVGIRFNQEEFEKIAKKATDTTTPAISEYIRRVLFNKPITGYMRNKSLDDFMGEMILLRSELNALGNNFNQAVRKLHTCDTVGEVKTWLLFHGKGPDNLQKKIEEIKKKMDEISDQWLQ